MNAGAGLGELAGKLALLVGSPLEVHQLKHKPGRRRTSRVTGPHGAVIVKEYASERAATVADRLQSLSGGPTSPTLPEVLHVNPGAHLVVLTEIPGQPLRLAVLDGDTATCRRAGAALGGWHQAWAGRGPTALSSHAVDRELELLTEKAKAAPKEIGEEVADRCRQLGGSWQCSTVVHRDLYEEQVMVADDGSIGLIDLDDVALGPPELDIGNLIGHLDLLGHRAGQSMEMVKAALVQGYTDSGARLDVELLDRCRRLTLLRLACIHTELAMVDLVGVATSHSPP